jgi:hypothetical protein
MQFLYLNRIKMPKSACPRCNGRKFKNELRMGSKGTVWENQRICSLCGVLSRKEVAVAEDEIPMDVSTEGSDSSAVR